MDLSVSIDRVSRSHQNRFTSVRLDRLVEHRDDEEWVQRALASDTARFVPLWRSRSLIASTDAGQLAVYLRNGELDHLDSIQPPTLLGTDGKRYFFAVSINDQQREAVLSRHPEARFVDLRRASVDMDAKHAGVLAYAKALHYWQYRHGFCGVCGNPNHLSSAGHKLVCSNEECARQSFPRIDPAIIVLVTHGNACLLGRNANWPPKRFSTLAGFVEPGESLEDAVVREVFEEARVRLTDIRYVSSQPWPFPASSMCGFYAEAESRDCAPSEEMEELRWFTTDELTAAVEDGSLLLSPPVSIAFRLIADWYLQQAGADLEAVTRRVRGKV
ncbi:NAD(+) diphosphatase [Elongatibacter sediminis]|uniref:NAD(+) diphosphatase n=1 Tax=Elongatibacter sediminis TaxID=3119006 RepID=A0AAW9RF62_9GAMM